jgi:NADPH:quinone reductase-like Zn-dependent oxidoreductase
VPNHVLGHGSDATYGPDRSLRTAALSLVVSQRLTIEAPKEHSSDLWRLAELVEDGMLAPIIDMTCALNQIPEAMCDLQAGGTVDGRLV